MRYDSWLDRGLYGALAGIVLLVCVFTFLSVMAKTKPQGAATETSLAAAPASPVATWVMGEGWSAGKVRLWHYEDHANHTICFVAASNTYPDAVALSCLPRLGAHQ